MFCLTVRVRFLGDKRSSASPSLKSWSVLSIWGVLKMVQSCEIFCNLRLLTPGLCLQSLGGFLFHSGLERYYKIAGNRKLGRKHRAVEKRKPCLMEGIKSIEGEVQESENSPKLDQIIETIRIYSKACPQPQTWRYLF